jgi:protein tyrosine/serine phosphatase
VRFAARPRIRAFLRKLVRSRAWITGIALACAIGATYAVVHRHYVPKRFAEVVPGRLYRSARITPAQLEFAARHHGIRTVLSLLDPGAPESIAERAAAQRLGIRWLNVPLPGNGASTAEARARILEIESAPENAPLLVHCAAGVNRTGLAIGLYRIHEQAWTYEQVLSEMLRFGFENEAHHEDLREALRSEARDRDDDRGCTASPPGPEAGPAAHP